MLVAAFARGIPILSFRGGPAPLNIMVGDSPATPVMAPHSGAKNLNFLVGENEARFDAHHIQGSLQPKIEAWQEPGTPPAGAKGLRAHVRARPHSSLVLGLPGPGQRPAQHVARLRRAAIFRGITCTVCGGWDGRVWWTLL